MATAKKNMSMSLIIYFSFKEIGRDKKGKGSYESQSQADYTPFALYHITNYSQNSDPLADVVQIFGRTLLLSLIHWLNVP